MSDRPVVTDESTLAQRRSAMKGWMLAEAAVFVRDNAQFPNAVEVAERLGLPPGALENVAALLAEELFKRAEKHPDIV